MVRVSFLSLLIFFLTISISISTPINKKHTLTTTPLKPKKNTTTTTTNAKIKIKLPKPLNSTNPKTNLPKTLNSTMIKKNNITKSLNFTNPKIKLPKPLNSTMIKKKAMNSTLHKEKPPITTIIIPSNSTKKAMKSPTKPKLATATSTSARSKDPTFSWVTEDFARISTTSKVYLAMANNEMTRSFKPYVGHRYAPSIAAAASVCLLLLPLAFLVVLFRRILRHLSLRRGLLLIQAYLAIYFATLAAAALATGLEPLRFFHAASPASYAATQALQTLGYALYLLVQLVDLFVVCSSSSSSSESSASQAAVLALAQIIVGIAVGMHYYVAVFHRAVAGEPPRADWKVHGVYAACFVGICVLAQAERRKKAYGDAGDDGGKRS